MAEGEAEIFRLPDDDLELPAISRGPGVSMWQVNAGKPWSDDEIADLRRGAEHGTDDAETARVSLPHCRGSAPEGGRNGNQNPRRGALNREPDMARRTLWRAPRPAPDADLPDWIPPQLAELVTEAPDGTDYLHEIKLTATAFTPGSTGAAFAC